MQHQWSSHSHYGYLLPYYTMAVEAFCFCGLATPTAAACTLTIFWRWGPFLWGSIHSANGYLLSYNSMVVETFFFTAAHYSTQYWIQNTVTHKI